MKNSQYPSLDLCKKLTKIGFPQSENDWTLYKHTLFEETRKYHWTIRNELWISDYEDIKESYICPSVIEMLDLMPSYLQEEFWLNITI